MTIDRIVRVIARTAICLLFIKTWGLSGWGKVFGAGTPEWFTERFTGSIFESFPGGVSGSYTVLGIIEFMGFLGFVAALVCGESLRGSKAPIMKVSLAWSLVVFLALGFGQKVTGDFDGAANSFAYFAGTLVALFWIQYDESRA